LTDEECTKLFGEFVRIKNEKTKTIQGSGLGLSTVKKISKLYDGDVHVESEPDKGSKFIFIFGEMKKNT
jgi:signal transduction histidine kinase